MSHTSPDMRDELWSCLDRIQDHELRQGIVDLFADAQRRVDAGEVQLVLVAARRLACLYTMLVQAGMPPLEGALVVSDRYLDTHPSQHVSGVLILDDSVVLGTTLYGLFNDVNKYFTPQTVICRAVVVDTETSAQYLLDSVKLEALHERSSADVRQFAVDIVEQLFAAQVPFFADFPATTAFSVSADSWHHYLEHDGWYVADVTAPLLDAPNREALALIPGEEMRNAILTRLPPAVAELTDTLKLRAYVCRDGESLQVVFVPLATIAACTIEAVNEALRAAFADDDGKLLSGLLDWAPEGKHRAVQLLVSLCVLSSAQPAMIDSFGQEFAHEVLAAATDQGALSPYLGEWASLMSYTYRRAVERFRLTAPDTYAPPIQARITRPSPPELMSEVEMRNVLFDTRELLSAIGLPDAPSKGSLTKVGLILGHALASMFGFVDSYYEQQQREQIRQLGSTGAYEQWRASGSERLLDQGFTLHELTEELVPDCLGGDAWQRALVSLGIDMGNDLGVVVPVTRFDELRDIVYRSYRIGETAYLAGRPLVMVDQQTWEVDLVTARAKDSFPVLFRTLEIRDSVTQADSDEWAQLQEIIRTAIPSQVTNRHFGTVVRLDDQAFLADLRSTTDDDDGQAAIAIDAIDDSQHDSVRPGASFMLFEYVEHEPRVRFTTVAADEIHTLRRTAALLAERDGD